MRTPAVAGQFYSSGKKELFDEIKGCFESGFGPGMPAKKEGGGMLGVISPHAGYAFSGPCAAHCYKAVAEAKKPDVFVILGPSHQGLNSCVSFDSWNTPLGTAKVDSELGKALVEGLGIPVDEKAHASEHSIEVQLPFLQFACSDFRFLPVMVGHDIKFREIASGIRKAVEQTGKKAVYIVSSDFTHYGLNYGYTIPGDAKENMYRLDNKAIEEIKSLEPEKFLNHLKSNETTICGALPILAFLSMIKQGEVKAKKASLLKYYTSGDIIGSYKNAVGYAAIAFY